MTASGVPVRLQAYFPLSSFHTTLQSRDPWGAVSCGWQGAGYPESLSSLAQEKLRYLQQQLQDETPRRQEAELQELEQKLEAGLTRHGLGPAGAIQGCSGPPGSPEEPPRPRGLASSAWGLALRAGEGLSLSEQELQKVSTGLEELRWAGTGGGGWARPQVEQSLEALWVGFVIGGVGGTE